MRCYIGQISVQAGMIGANNEVGFGSLMEDQKILSPKRKLSAQYTCHDNSGIANGPFICSGLGP